MASYKIGRYEIKSEVGRGGMGAVYRAYDPRFRREVALKVLPRQFVHDPTFRARFEREAQVIASLEHPAIVPVYDFGEQDDQLYFVMRFMPGGSLAKRLKGGPLSLGEAANILTHLAPALDEAHRRGIIHRDLKPGNILFDQHHNPYISDFGIAKLTQSSAHLTGSAIIGTPAYMSPEQVHGDKALDGRSDIYALGIILFEMLTARKPYQANTPAKLMMKHILDPVPNVLTVKADLPRGCRTVIAKAMAKKPNERYPTARAMASALQKVVHPQNRSSNRQTTLGLPLILGVLLAVFLLVVSTFILLRSNGVQESDVAVSSPQSAVASADNTPAAELATSSAGSSFTPAATIPGPAIGPSTSTPVATFTFVPGEAPFATSTFIVPNPQSAAVTSTPVSTFTPILGSTPLPSSTPVPPGPEDSAITLLLPSNGAEVKEIPVPFRVEVIGKQESDILQLRMWGSDISQQNTVTTRWRSVEENIYETDVEELPEGLTAGQNYSWTVVLLNADGEVRDFNADARQILWNQPEGYHREIDITLLEPAAQSRAQNSPLEFKVRVTGMQEGDGLQLWMGTNRSHLQPVEAEWLPAAGSDEVVATLILAQPPKGYGQQYYWTVTLVDPFGIPLPVPDAVELRWDE